MARHLQRYIISFAFLVFILFFAAFFARNKLDKFLGTFLQEIEKAASLYLGCDARAGRIRYIFPASIGIDKFNIFKAAMPDKESILSLERVRLSFSLPALLKRRKLVFTNAEIAESFLNYPECFLLAKEHFAEIIAFLKSLSSDAPFLLLLKKTSLAVSPEKNLDICLGLRVDRDIFLSYGLIKDAESSGLTPNIWQYGLKGYLTQEGIAVDNLELRRKYFYTQLRGTIEGRHLRFNGFLSLSSFWKDIDMNFKDFNIAFALRGLTAQKTAVTITRKDASGLNLFDLSGVINLDLPKIEIEKLDFFLNNIPFSLKGNVSSLKKGFFLDLSLASIPSYPQNVRQKSPQSFDLALNGVFEKSVFDGAVGLAFNRNIKNTITPQRMDLKFKQAFFENRAEYLRVGIKTLNVEYHSLEVYRRLEVSDAISLFFIKDNFLRLVKLNANVYEGKFWANGQVNWVSMPPKCDFNFFVRDGRAEKFKDSLEYFSKVEGNLNISADYHNYPVSGLNGKIEIYNGYLNNFEFFKWLADFFGLSSLKRLGFDKATFNFLVNDEAAEMEDIALEAKDVLINGYYGIYGGDLVKSKISLKLSKETSGSSEKLKPIVRLLGKEFTGLDFDFQLSGIFNAMNFKWLKSDFKKKIQDALPGFIERGIEKRVEEAIEAISAS